MTPFNCKPGSPWHDWQNAGENWAKLNPYASPDLLETTARNFAAYTRGPDEARAAQRAFAQGARLTLASLRSRGHLLDIEA